MFPKPEAELQALIDELSACLNEKYGFMTQSPVPGVLRRIARHGSPAALPWLLHLVHSTTKKIRVEAEQTVESLLPKLEVDQLIEMELLVRGAWLQFYSRDHSYRTETEHGARLATLDSSGWIREKAVLALIRSGDTRALPFVLLRSNDWVEQVRRAADRWFAAHANAVSKEQLVRCLPILAALTERSYGGASTIVKTLLARLAPPTATPLLMGSLLKSNARTRRLLFTLLAQSGALQDPDTQSVLLRHSDPILGVLLLKYLRLHSSELPTAVVNQALTSKSATLRRYALYCLSDVQISHLTALLSQAAFDSAQGVRSFAQYHLLKQITAEELQSRYGSVLQDPHARNSLCAACILGFHEAGGKWEVAQYLELAQHKSMRVRVAALRTFAAAHFEDALPWLKTALASDDSPSLGKAALAILRLHPKSLTITEIKFMLSLERSTAVRLRVFSLLCLRGKWEQLPVLFEMLHDSSGVLEQHVLSRLSVWLSRFNLVQTQPSSVQTEQALAALDDAKDRMGSRLSTEFRSLLRAVTPR